MRDKYGFQIEDDVCVSLLLVRSASRSAQFVSQANKYNQSQGTLIELRRKAFSEYLQRHAHVSFPLSLSSLSSRSLSLLFGLTRGMPRPDLVLSQLEKSSHLKALIRKGIPTENRRAVWLAVTGAGKLKAAAPGYYQKLLRDHEKDESVAPKQIELVRVGARLSCAPSWSRVQQLSAVLAQDVRRTFPGHPAFESAEGIAKLRRVLVAYSWRNPSVGYAAPQLFGQLRLIRLLRRSYCQSMNFICAMLLIVLLMDEEDTFWMMVVVIEQLLPRDYYTNTMLASQVDQQVFCVLIADKLPRIHQHFVSHDLSLPLISTQWFLCQYVNSMPTEVSISTGLLRSAGG